MASKSDSDANRYGKLVSRVFWRGYSEGCESIPFVRSDLERAATEEGIALPKNLGDVIYSFRFRGNLPPDILATQRNGREWIIELAGRSKYRFVMARMNRILPRSDLAETKLPDATPELIGRNALSDEQSLLAKTRYNQLIGTFLGVTAYSLQNHLRTTAPNGAQIEIDEVYLAVDKFGRQFVVPVQAKRGSDSHGTVQTSQDIAWCRKKFPHFICRPVSVQFMSSDKIAMFELTEEDGEIKIAEERHYHLVPANKITKHDLESYSTRAF